MGRPGRPPVGERIMVRLPPTLLAAIDARASNTGRTRSQTIRDLLSAAIAEPEPSRVDLAQLRAQLARSPLERLRHNTAAVNRTRRLRGAPRR